MWPFGGFGVGGQRCAPGWTAHAYALTPPLPSPPTPSPPQGLEAVKLLPAILGQVRGERGGRGVAPSRYYCCAAQAHFTSLRPVLKLFFSPVRLTSSPPSQSLDLVGEGNAAVMMLRSVLKPFLSLFSPPFASHLPLICRSRWT